MSDQEYMDADFEVIGMVNKGRGTGGKLPAKVVHFIPEERAEAVLALDERIQKLRKNAPTILVWAGLIFLLIIKEFI